MPTAKHSRDHADSEYVAQHVKQQIDRMGAEFTANKQDTQMYVCVCVCVCKLRPTDKSALCRLETWKLELEDWHCVDSRYTKMKMHELTGVTQ